MNAVVALFEVVVASDHRIEEELTSESVSFQPLDGQQAIVNLAAVVAPETDSSVNPFDLCQYSREIVSQQARIERLVEINVQT